MHPDYKGESEEGWRKEEVEEEGRRKYAESYFRVTELLLHTGHCIQIDLGDMQGFFSEET